MLDAVKLSFVVLQPDYQEDTATFEAEGLGRGEPQLGRKAHRAGTIYIVRNILK